MSNVVFVGTAEFGLSGSGKMMPNFFFRHFNPVLEDNGVKVTAFDSISDMTADIASYFEESVVVIMIYNEEGLRSADFRRRVAAFEKLIKRAIPKATFLHSVAVCDVLSSKKRLNAALREAGVPVPSVVLESKGEPVFSNEDFGSQRPVALVDAGAAIDPGRYNTNFVDTRHAYKGVDHYVCLRAMCVGSSPVSLFVRARPVADGNPSVHAADTPRDPDLLNTLYEEVLLPRRAAIAEACRSIAKVFGLGFYSHDILPCAETGGVFICETGMKFDDMSIRYQLTPIKGKLNHPGFLDGSDVRAAAYAFLYQCRTLGVL